MLENEGADVAEPVAEAEVEAEPDVVEAEPEVEAVPEGPGVAELVSQGSDPDHTLEWLKGVEAALPEGQTRFNLGDPRNWPPEAQQLLWNTIQEQQANSKKLADQLEKRDGFGRDLDAEKRQVQAERASVHALWTSDRIQQFIKSVVPDGPAPDPYTPEGIDWAVRQQAGKVLTQFMDVLKTEAEIHAKAHQEAEAKVAETAKINEAAAYMRQFPQDFDNDVIFTRIETLMRQSNYAMSLKDAHEFVMGQLAIADDKDAMERARQRARNRIRAGSGKQPGPPTRPAGLDTAQELSFYNAHPDAVQREYEYFLKHGNSY